MIEIICRLIILIILGYSLGKLIYVTKKMEEIIEEIKLELLKIKIENNGKLKEEDLEEMEKLMEEVLEIR